MRLLVLIIAFMICKLVNPNFEMPGTLAVVGIWFAILDLLSLKS